MGLDWHDAALENQEGAIVSLKEQVSKLRNKAAAEAPALPGLEFREAANIDLRALASGPQPEADDYLKRIDGADFWSAEIPETRWIVPGILRPGLGVLSAPQKSGKSTLVTDLALAAATGGAFLNNFHAEPGDVLYLNFEDDLNDLRTRAKALGYSTNQGFPRLQIEFDAPRQDAGGLELIEKWAENHPERRLAVIDPFVKFRRFRRPEEKGLDAYQLDYFVAGELHALAVKYNLALLLVNHEKKSPGVDWVFQSTGSTALTAAANTVMRLERKRGQSDAALKITGRGIKEQDFALRGDGLAWKYCGDAETYRDSQTTLSIAAILRERGETTVRDIAETLEISQGVARVTLNRGSVDRPQASARFYKSADGKRWGVRQ